MGQNPSDVASITQTMRKLQSVPYSYGCLQSSAGFVISYLCLCFDWIFSPWGDRLLPEAVQYWGNHGTGEASFPPSPSAQKLK